MGGSGGGDSGGGGGGGGRGGCCTQNYDHHHAAKLDRIMVKYRPIAPKPAASGSVFGPTTNNNNQLLAKPRAKRRYVRHKKTREEVVEEKNSGSGSVSGSDRSEEGERQLITLPLLPETPGSVRVLNPTDKTPIRAASSDRGVVAPNPQQPMSTVVVECVEGVWSGHDRKIANLAEDTCPGFVSDGYNRVLWTNQAYKMKAGSEMVRLVMEQQFPPMYSSFVCRVRLQYTRRNERRWMVVPCDVWRMNGGDFAWRMDVQAALSLGR